MTTEQIIAEHLVRQGAALLDQISRDWIFRVTLQRLDIASPERCVIAEAFGEGSYIIGVERVTDLLFDAGIVIDTGGSLAHDHGFIAGYHSFDADEIPGVGQVSELFIYSRDLTAAWVKVVGERREAFAAAQSE